jgi:hypothetical protein
MYKFGKFKFSILTNLPKSNIARLDKISIFEYFGIIEERKKGKDYEVLLKEIMDYMDSSIFLNEFKYCISTDIKKHKFLFLNLSLLTNRLAEEKINYQDIENFTQQQKLIFLFKNLPLYWFCKENVKLYLKQNQINKMYTNVIEAETIKRFNKLDFSALKTRKAFLKDINNPENDNFKNKYIKNFLEIENDIEIEKLLTYFIAHVKI